ncbi:MAG: type II secretion system secretin GspD [Proteobacteria bacterium]|nr:type II secretion system secretin GspD [Pseudomonadota bacterium]
MIAVLLSGLMTWCIVPSSGWAAETDKNQAAAEAARKQLLSERDIAELRKSAAKGPASTAQSKKAPTADSTTKMGGRKPQAKATAPEPKGSSGEAVAEKEEDSPWTKVNVPDELATGIEFKKPKKGTKFAFNLVDADLVELIKIMGNITGKAFILGGKAPKLKATIYAPTRITAAEAYQAFLSVLQVNGLTVEPAGRYLKISSVGGAVQKNMPIVTAGKRVPVGDQIVTRIQPLEHVSGEELSDLLGRFKSKDGDIVVYVPTNTLIITDYGSSIRRLLKLVRLLDAPGTGEKIWIEPINHSDATELSDLIMEIFDTEPTSTSPKKPTKSRKKRSTKSSRPSGSGVVGSEDQANKISKIIPEVRTNSLIIVASENAYLRILELINRLDVPIPGDGTLHVHKMQNSDAVELAKTLNNLSKGAQRSTGSARRKSGTKTTGDSSASLFEGEVQISADKTTNSLVIVSSLRDYISLKQVIEKLDVKQRQVFVEAVIMEVGLEKNRDVGVGFHAGTMVDSGDGSSLVYGASTPTQSLSSILMVPGAMSGLAAGARGPALEGTEDILGPGISIPAFGVVLQALQTNSDVNVLSTPNILATDNVEATINVGENVPVQAGYNPIGGLMSSMAGGGTAATGGAAALGYLGGLGGAGGFSINRQSVGITLNITPHINDDDQVRLEIKLDISEVVSIDSQMGPVIAEKDAQTTSVVADQQTVVIGGLMTDNTIETTSKIPVLGDIPLLGFLFRQKSTLTKKRNLLIFLTPYIIRDSDDFRDIFYRKMAERREFIERWTAFEYHRVDPHIDWTRTKGVISEISYIIGQAQRDEELKRLSEVSDEVEHTPKPAVQFQTTGTPVEEADRTRGSFAAADQEESP